MNASCWLVLFSLLTEDTGRAASAPHPFAFADMVAMRRLSEPASSPDGNWVAFVLRTYSLETNKGSADIYLVSADGKTLRQLTTSPAQDYGPTWSPDGKRLAFISNRSGSSQVWTIAPEGGEAQQLTSLPVDVDNVSWSPSGGHVAFTADVYPGRSMQATADQDAALEKDPVKAKVYESLLFRHWDQWEDGKRSHLFVMPVAGGDATDLTPDLDGDTPTKPFGGREEIAWSPDGKELCFAAHLGKDQAWTTNVDLYVTDLAGKRRCVTQSNQAMDTGPAYSPDGKWLAYRAMSRPGYESDRFEVMALDRTSGKLERLTSAFDRSFDEILWSADSKTVFATAEDTARKAIFTIDVATGKVNRIVADHYNGSMQLIANHELAFTRDSLRAPTELFACDATGNKVRALTSINAERLAQIAFAEPEEFWFEGAGGEKVHSWLLKPVGFTAGQKYPVAFLIHGGPQGSWEDHFHYRWNPQVYAGAGYVTIAVDPRGSTGYGQKFCDDIRGDWGGKPYQDLMQGLDHAIAHYEFIAADRVGALGASFGGYMINWIAGHTDRFKCLVSHDGNLDELAAYYMTEELWFPEWDHLGTPWEHPDHYDSVSPQKFVANWKTPMLVIHGGNDFRVVDTQGMATFTALQRRGIPSRFLYFPDENHWVLKPRNSELWHREVIGWLDRWLKGARGPGAGAGG
ncbi:MAG: S9 family peptidase [Planctomycetota bacterium]